MASLIRDIISFQAPTSTGNQDYLSAKFAGVTPKAAIFVFHERGTVDTQDDDISLSIGFCDSAGNNRGMFFTDQDNVNPSDGRTAIYPRAALYPFPTGVEAVGGTASLISGGVRVNYSSIWSGRNIHAFVVLLGGDAIVNSSVVSLSSTFAGAGSSAAVAVGHPVHAAFCFSEGNGCGLNNRANNSIGSLGMFVNNSSGVKQTSHAFSSMDNVSPTDAVSLYSEQRALLRATSIGASPDYSIEVGSFTATGFSETSRNGAWDKARAYLCFELASDYNADIQQTSTPSATGTRGISGLPHTPEFFAFINSTATSAEVGKDDRINGYGYCVEDGGAFNHYTVNGQSIDNVNPSNSIREYADSVRVRDPAGGFPILDEFVISAVSAGQYDENYTSADAQNHLYSVMTIGPSVSARKPDFMPFFANMITGV